MADSTCLVEELRKCKQSSKEAVENLDTFSEFKKYMHVPRKVEEELEKLILNVNQSSKSQLILVCGGVGDGKSHLISYFKDKYDFLRDKEKFYLHNDATESFEPEQTSIQTLAKTFRDFSDDGLNSGKVSKAILAINLGALANFIDSKEGQENYTELSKYVMRKKILESHIGDDSFDEESSFQVINFSDFHMFQLTEQGPKSDFMQKMIEKITAKDEGNPFYRAYSQNCLEGCSVASQCPIKQNYELLCDERVQAKIIDTLIQAIIKEKLIVSTRGLLNFLHDILVPPQFDSLTGEKIKTAISDLQWIEHAEQLLPILMFYKEDASSIHSAVSNLRITQLRSEQLDQIMIEFKTRQDGAVLFPEYIDMQYLPYLNEKLLLESPWRTSLEVRSSEVTKQKLINVFVYLYYFIPKSEHQIFEDRQYIQFMRNLYSWNCGQKIKLINLYSVEVKTAIFNWDGKGRSDQMYVQIGQPQTLFRSRQNLDLSQDLNNLPLQRETELSKFLTSMLLIFKPENSDSEETADLELDYSLYHLICRIGNGYRPNKKDKLKFIKFGDFVNNVSHFGRKQREVFIDEMKGSRSSYKLAYNKDFNQFTFTEV